MGLAEVSSPKRTGVCSGPDPSWPHRVTAEGRARAPSCGNRSSPAGGERFQLEMACFYLFLSLAYSEKENRAERACWTPAPAFWEGAGVSSVLTEGGQTRPGGAGVRGWDLPPRRVPSEL